MIYKVYFERADGEQDSVAVAGATIEEIREKTEKVLDRHNATGLWSEKLK